MAPTEFVKGFVWNVAHNPGLDVVVVAEIGEPELVEVQRNRLTRMYMVTDCVSNSSPSETVT